MGSAPCWWSLTCLEKSQVSERSHSQVTNVNGAHCDWTKLKQMWTIQPGVFISKFPMIWNCCQLFIKIRHYQNDVRVLVHQKNRDPEWEARSISSEAFKMHVYYCVTPQYVRGQLVQKHLKCTFIIVSLPNTFTPYCTKYTRWLLNPYSSILWKANIDVWKKGCTSSQNYDVKKVNYVSKSSPWHYKEEQHWPVV